MPNGFGDISPLNVSRDDFFKMSDEDREWMSFQVSQSLSKTCHGRTALCDGKYVKKTSVKITFGLMIAFLLGLGVLQVSVIIPYVVRAALASVLGGL